MKNERTIRDQRGLTLVELLLSVAIFGIVMTAILSFMTVVSRQYTKNNNEVNIQNEVQTLTTHLQNLIVSTDTNLGIVDNRLFMIDDEGFEVIEYDSAKGYIYYYSMQQLGLSTDEIKEYTDLDDRDKKLKKAISIVESNPITNIDAQLSTYLLTEYVTEFKISPNVTENYVAINLTLEKDNSKYSASKNIFLRNKMYDIDTSGLASTPVKSTTSTDGAGDDATASASESGSTAATPEPSTAAATPEPSTAAATPEPSTAAATPEPSTAAATPEPSTAAATPEPSTPAASEESSEALPGELPPAPPSTVDVSTRISKTMGKNEKDSISEFQYQFYEVPADRKYVVFTFKRTDVSLTSAQVSYWQPWQEGITIYFNSDGYAYLTKELNGETNPGVYAWTNGQFDCVDISFYN
jgi:prepilin-type N-terminal cleavage/methylation domain-containing protein